MRNRKSFKSFIISSLILLNVVLLYASWWILKDMYTISVFEILFVLTCFAIVFQLAGIYYLVIEISKSTINLFKSFVKERNK